MNIILTCNGGMSTSLLVEKMKREATAQNKDDTIKAVAIEKVKNYLDTADVILLGPQIQYALSKTKELVKEKNIAVDVIQPMHYGLCDGAAVLKQAEKLYAERG